MMYDIVPVSDHRHQCGNTNERIVFLELPCTPYRTSLFTIDMSKSRHSAKTHVFMPHRMAILT
jgi:hypothetical protein